MGNLGKVSNRFRELKIKKNSILLLLLMNYVSAIMEKQWAS